MSFTQLSCGETAGNTGKQDCFENFGQDELLIICPKNTEIDTKELAETEATWQTLINAAKATRCYPLFGHFNAEFENEGRVTIDGWAGKKKTVRDGTRSAKFMFEEISLYNQKELKKHNGRTNLAFYAVTANGYIKGWTNDNIVFKPIPFTDFYVNDLEEIDGNNYGQSSVSIEYEGSYWNDKGAWVKPTTFDPLLLDGIKDAEVSATLGATGTTATVRGAADSVGIVGLVAANFNLYNDATPTTPIAVVVGTDNGDGTYVLTWADQAAAGATTLTLFDQPVGTSGYEAASGTLGKATAIL